MELLDKNQQSVSALIMSTWAKDVGKLVNHKTPEIWFAGDPQKYGVISVNDGGGPLRYAYYSRGRQPPTFTFREPTTDNPILSGAGAVSAGTYEMQRENGRVVMRLPGAQSEKPKRHGALDDPNYPSPRKLRRTLGFTLDILIHIAAGAAASVATAPEPARYALLHRDWHNLGVVPALAVLYFLAASFIDRAIIQAIFHTTIVKAVFGLVALRPDTGRYPSFGRLLAIWLLDLYLPIAILAEIVGNGGSAAPDNIDDYFLTAVRRRDRRREEDEYD